MSHFLTNKGDHVWWSFSYWLPKLHVTGTQPSPNNVKDIFLSVKMENKKSLTAGLLCWSSPLIWRKACVTCIDVSLNENIVALLISGKIHSFPEILFKLEDLSQFQFSSVFKQNCMPCRKTLTDQFCKEVMFDLVFIIRNLVSASQDGKLIVWDSYTTNKVLSSCVD